MGTSRAARECAADWLGIADVRRQLFLRRSRRRFAVLFIRMIVKTVVSPAAMSLFDLRQLLALFVRELGSHLLMRVHDDLVNPSACVSPNLPELASCFVNDRRNFGELFRSQIEFSL